MTNLINLNINYNDALTSLQAIRFSYLIELHIGGYSLTNLPDLSNLSNLSYFTVTYTSLTSLPDLSGLTNLITLSIHSNAALASLPDLSGLTNLITLSIHSNAASSLPTSQGSLV